MNTLKFKPEGWNNEITELNSKNIENYRNTKEVLITYIFNLKMD